MIYTILIIALIVIFVYNKVKVPKSLSNLPRISILTQLKYFKKTTLTDDYYEQILDPKLQERGYVARWNRGRWGVVISKPEIVKDLLRGGQQFLKIINTNTKSLHAKFKGSVTIVASNGEDWKRIRKLVNPIFHQSFKTDVFAECVQETIDAFSDRVTKSEGNPIPVEDLMQLMTLDILGKGVLKHNFEAVKSLGSSHYFKLYITIMKHLFNPLYFVFPMLDAYPFGKRAKAHEDVKEFNKFVTGLIEQRRKDLQENKFLDSKDLLTIMLKDDPDNTYEPLTNEELIANLNVFIMAGHDTTANTLTYAMYYLAKYQDIQDKLRNEIYTTLEVAPNSFDLTIPTAEHLKSMPYLSCFIKEVMRITPAVLQIDRQLNSDYTIPGENVVLPKGTHLNLSVYSIQKDPRIYSNPDEFNPERFLNAKYDTDVYMPFGGGTRMCVGMNFSLMEQKVFLTMLLQKFHLNIDKNNPDFKKLRIQGFGFTKAKDLKVNFTSRF